MWSGAVAGIALSIIVVVGSLTMAEIVGAPSNNLDFIFRGDREVLLAIRFCCACAVCVVLDRLVSGFLACILNIAMSVMTLAGVSHSGIIHLRRPVQHRLRAAPLGTDNVWPQGDQGQPQALVKGPLVTGSLQILLRNGVAWGGVCRTLLVFGSSDLRVCGARLSWQKKKDVHLGF